MTTVHSGASLRTDKGTHLHIDTTGVVLGRAGISGDSEDRLISARHLSARLDPTGIVIEDLDSTNGTWVAGTRVTTATLRNGDVLRVGHTILTAVVTEVPKPRPVPPPPPLKTADRNRDAAARLALVESREHLITTVDGLTGWAAVRRLSARSGISPTRIDTIRRLRNRIAHAQGPVTRAELVAATALAAQVTKAIERRDRRGR